MENKTWKDYLGSTKLLTESNLKTIKGESLGYKTSIMHLSPHKISGHNMCPSASAGCAKACLNTAGHGRFKSTQVARLKRTRFFIENRAEFISRLDREIDLAIKRAEKNGVTPVFRLNGTSDLIVENVFSDILKKYSDYQFYDYTKIEKRFFKELPSNYHLVFSLAEDNDSSAKRVLEKGGSVAVVFKDMPKTFWGYPVVSGEETDLRFLDPANVIIGLVAKGRAKKDGTGFVR